MKPLTILAWVIVLGLTAGAAQAQVRNGYWTVMGPKVSGISEGWSVCRQIVRDISPLYKLYRVTVLSNRRAKCWYTM